MRDERVLAANSGWADTQNTEIQKHYSHHDQFRIYQIIQNTEISERNDGLNFEKPYVPRDKQSEQLKNIFRILD